MRKTHRKLPHVELVPLEANDRAQFVRDNQEAFLYGATHEFGMRDDHFEEDGQIISSETIERCIGDPQATTYRIVLNGRKVGGLVLSLSEKGTRGSLELLFVLPDAHSAGIGQAAWREVERRYPQVQTWELVTPYFEKRNIHFYVNKLGFHIVEFYNHYHTDPNSPRSCEEACEQDEMFRFEKTMDCGTGGHAAN